MLYVKAFPDYYTVFRLNDHLGEECIWNKWWPWLGMLNLTVILNIKEVLLVRLVLVIEFI